jgi:hypothetical protein
MSEKDPRVPLKVPNAAELAGQTFVRFVISNVVLGGLKLWYLYGLFTSNRRLARNRSQICHSFDSDVCAHTTPDACSVLRPRVPAWKLAG